MTDTYVEKQKGAKQLGPYQPISPNMARYMPSCTIHYRQSWFLVFYKLRLINW